MGGNNRKARLPPSDNSALAPESSAKVSVQKLYLKLLKSKWNIRFLVLMYIFLILIPAYYTINYKLPDANQLNRADGKLYLKHFPGKGSVVRLITRGGEIQFSCMEPFGRSYSFPVRIELIKAVERKDVTILWYRRPMYIGSYVNYIVQIDVDDRSIFTYEKTEKGLHSGAILAFCLSIAALFAFIYIYKSNNKRSNRLEKFVKQQTDV